VLIYFSAQESMLCTLNLTRSLTLI